MPAHTVTTSWKRFMDNAKDFLWGNPTVAAETRRVQAPIEPEYARERLAAWEDEGGRTARSGTASLARECAVKDKS